jgi:3-oxoacyl-[acyl-carrier protein] reductase
LQITFQGKRALVTGAAHGIGRSIAEAFARDGAEVVAVDILEGEMTPLATDHITPRPCDVTDKAALEQLNGEFGPFDVLVHSAGGVCGQVGRPLESIPEPDWHAILAVNLTAAFLLAQVVTPAMKSRGRGRVVYISSGAGLGVSLTGIQAYAAAKAGEIGLTRQLAHELGPFGITVNSVAPGFVRSNPTSERQWQGYGMAGQQDLVSRIAMRRLGTPEDIALAVLFFSSDEASWITGQTLSVDGGK